GGFGFLDVAGTIVKQRKTCPADLVVRPQFDSAFAGFDRFLETAELHQRHTERVPAIEKIGIKLHAKPILLDRAAQIADGDVAAGVVKNFVRCLHLTLAQRPQGQKEPETPTRNFRRVLCEFGVKPYPFLSSRPPGCCRSRNHSTRTMRSLFSRILFSKPAFFSAAFASASGSRFSKIAMNPSLPEGTRSVRSPGFSNATASFTTSRSEGWFFCSLASDFSC